MAFCCVMLSLSLSLTIITSASTSSRASPGQKSFRVPRTLFYVSDSFIPKKYSKLGVVEFSNVTKSPNNPLLQEGLSAWDMAWWNTYPTVIYDNESPYHKFKLWYNGMASCGSHATKMCPATDYPNRSALPVTDRDMRCTFYAESDDGISWSRPSLGQVPWPTKSSSLANNIAMDCGSADPNRGILLDKNDPDPTRRYKAFGSFAEFNGASIADSRLGVVASADGRSWHSYSGVDSMEVNADTANNILFDKDLDMYLAFTRKDVKLNSTEFGVRREYRSTAKNASGPWSVAVEVGRGEAGYELYALLPWHMEDWGPGIYFAVASFYDDASPDERVYCELMHSIDYGLTWTRLAPRSQFIPLGTPGSFDDHTCYPARPIVDPQDNNTIRFYYAGGNGPHSGARSDFIALATARTNAFAGISTDVGELRLTSTPVTIVEDTLFVWIRFHTLAVSQNQEERDAPRLDIRLNLENGDTVSSLKLSALTSEGSSKDGDKWHPLRYRVEFDADLPKGEIATITTILNHATVYSLEWSGEAKHF